MSDSRSGSKPGSRSAGKDYAVLAAHSDYSLMRGVDSVESVCVAAAKRGAWELGIPAQRGQQLLEPEESERKAVLDGPDSERHGQVCFPDARRPLNEQRLLSPKPRAGGQRLHARALDGGVGGELQLLP